MRAAHDLDDAQLAELARMSVRASRAPDGVKSGLVAEIDAWLAHDPDRMER
jgi:adenosine deaminase